MIYSALGARSTGAPPLGEDDELTPEAIAWAVLEDLLPGRVQARKHLINYLLIKVARPCLLEKYPALVLSSHIPGGVS